MLAKLGRAVRAAERVAFALIDELLGLFVDGERVAGDRALHLGADRDERRIAGGGAAGVIEAGAGGGALVQAQANSSDETRTSEKLFMRGKLPHAAGASTGRVRVAGPPAAHHETPDRLMNRAK